MVMMADVSKLLSVNEMNPMTITEQVRFSGSLVEKTMMMWRRAGISVIAGIMAKGKKRNMDENESVTSPPGAIQRERVISKLIFRQGIIIIKGSNPWKRHARG